MPSNQLRGSVLILVLTFLCLVAPTSLGDVFAAPADTAINNLIQAMLDQVDLASVYTLTGDLSGAWEVSIEGQPYQISTRHALSGEPVQKAAQYLFQFYEDLGLDVEYHPFSFQGQLFNNIVAQKEGTIFPERIYLITSHYDDVPITGLAPGADDNASGTIGVMMAAKILSQYDFCCTLRFVNFGAEEYGMIGSKDYTQEAFNSGEDIQGVINLDMIAWNTPESTIAMDLHALSSVPGSTELATVFQEVVRDFNLDLVPELADPITTRSDHASFWKYDYPAILVTEDWGDFNPNYHSAGDDLDSIGDFSYYTSMIKASLGTLARLGCLVDVGWGTISGQVVDSESQVPVPGVSVWLHNPERDYTWFTRSDDNGNYQFSALTGWHKLSVDGLGYARGDSDIFIMQNQSQEIDIEIEAADEIAIFLPLSTIIRHAPPPGCP